MQTVKNVFNNVSPIRTYNAGSDFKETATHVVPEVVVQRVVSKMFGKGAPQPILDSALMHAISGLEHSPFSDRNFTQHYRQITQNSLQPVQPVYQLSFLPRTWLN